MKDNNDIEDLLLCLGRLKDSYLSLHILIANTISLKRRGLLKSLTDKQNEDFWRIQFALLIEQVILHHCKLLETKKRYAKHLPAEERKKLNDYFTSSRVQALLKFRNKCSGHVIDKDTNRPIETETLQILIQQIFGKNDLVNNIVPSFFDADNPGNPDTLIGIIENILKLNGQAKT